METPKDNHESDSRPTRRAVLRGLLGLASTAAAEDALAEPTLNRGIKASELVEMENGGNMPEGFVRMKINLEFNDGTGKIEGAGSFFVLENPDKAKAEFISNKSHPEFFENGVDFEAIKRGRKVALAIAGPYFAPNTKQIEGLALEDGEMVGQDQLKSGTNGLLVIKNGHPEIQYVNQITNFDAYLEELKRQKASAFQQTSYIRPGGQFNSSNLQKFELRFFVEGEINGVPKKGVVNFSTPMTYVEAVAALQQMSGFKVTKAIGLDTGSMSEGYFYDKEGQPYLMIDEQVGQHRNEYTNVLVLYAD